MSKKPNFLYFMTDQQRWDWLGCYGHPILQTPNIDAIASTGKRFTNFHTASPVCMPNRASFMTGRMPSVHGLRSNGCQLPVSANTFVDVLAASGYRTAAIGKSHLQEFTGLTARAFEDGRQRLIEDAWRDDGANYSQEDPATYIDGEFYPFELPYYGFQHVDMVTGHGDHCGGHYRQWLQANCSDYAYFTNTENELPHAYTCPQAYRTPMPEEIYPTAWIADRAIDWLNRTGEDSSPFFMFVSFPDPHHPFNPPGRYWDMYSPEQFEVSLPYEAHKNPNPVMQWITKNWLDQGGQLTRQTAMRTGEQQLREAMALTAGMISMIDDQVGRVIAALKQGGHYDNTVICFNTDHGDYLGDYGLLLKGMLPFRSITQSPMIWSDPADRSSGEISAMASTIDIAPSILERAGLVPYRGMQGRSFLPAMQSGEAHRDEVLIEYNDGMARLGFSAPARVRVLRTHKWRYTIYRDQDWGELYDLENDPNESHNLWDSAKHLPVRAELSLRLNHLLTAQMDESPVARYLA